MATCTRSSSNSCRPGTWLVSVSSSSDRADLQEVAIELPPREWSLAGDPGSSFEVLNGRLPMDRRYALSLRASVMGAVNQCDLLHCEV
jgi:hypothetical protein